MLYLRNDGVGNVRGKYFGNRFQVGAKSSESSHAEPGQVVANGTGGASASGARISWRERRTGHPRHASRCAGRIGHHPAVGGRRTAAHARVARHVSASRLRPVGPLELHLTGLVAVLVKTLL